MKHRLLLQRLQSRYLIAVIKVIVVPVGFKKLYSPPRFKANKNASKAKNKAEHLCKTLEGTTRGILQIRTSIP